MLQHQPVLLSETIKLLNIKPDGIYVDCTLGRAGHSIAILEKLNTGKLYCFEQDKNAITESQVLMDNYKNKNYEIIADNFRYLKQEMQLRKVTAVDGILYDLGVSSPQFDIAKRGFSYHQDGPLDMRMNQKQALTAQEIVNTWSLEGLNHIIRLYGEEKFSYQIAKAIVKFREQQEIKTTLELVEIIKSVLPMKVLKKAKHPARKTFQALRIVVNDELKSLELSLKQAISLLATGGVIVVISFHSLEDRIVKNIFKELVTRDNLPELNKLPIIEHWQAEYELINKKVIVPSQEELEQNSRSRSAKLRAIRKI